MQQPVLRLTLTGSLLGGLITQSRTRDVGDRSEDIDHAWELAGEILSRYGQPQNPPLADLTLEPDNGVKTMERVLERETSPLKDMLDARRGPAPARLKRGPTLH